MAASQSDARFDAVYRRLKSILEPYESEMYVVSAGPDSYGLDREPDGQRVPATWFAGVRRGKRYVSYYLMPVYTDPGLLDDVSPGLRKRMQGKSCFNFTREDDALFEELAALTRRGYERTAGDSGVATGGVDASGRTSGSNPRRSS
jgi:hypothetical protein